MHIWRVLCQHNCPYRSITQPLDWVPTAQSPSHRTGSLPPNHPATGLGPYRSITQPPDWVPTTQSPSHWTGSLPLNHPATGLGPYHSITLPSDCSLTRNCVPTSMVEGSLWPTENFHWCLIEHSLLCHHPKVLASFQFKLVSENFWFMWDQLSLSSLACRLGPTRKPMKASPSQD